MPKTLIQLAPHEMSPGWNADGSLKASERELEFRGLWMGEERDFYVRITWTEYDPAIIFAIAAEPERGNFFNCPRFDYPGRPPELPFLSLPQHNKNKVEGIPPLLEVYAGLPWGRFYYLDADFKVCTSTPPQYRLFLSFEGWGEMCAAPYFGQRDSLFRWQSQAKPTELAELSSLELLGRFLPELQDSNSDATFLKHHLALSYEEQKQLYRPLTRGNYAEWETVLRLFTRSRTHLWSGSARNAIFQSSSRKQPGVGLYLNNELQESYVTSPQRFYDWTIAYFQPRPAFHLLNHWVVEKWNPTSVSWKLTSARPTAHEQLEAMVELRDWLSDKATREEIDSLLIER